MKSIIWKIELAAAVLLAVSALVWGLRPGVWNYGGFYRMAAGEQSRTYTRPGCSTVEVTEDNRLRIQSPAGQTAEFTLSLAENGSYRAAEMAMDGVVRNVTYNTATGTFMTAGDSWSISTLVQEKAGFSPGLTDNALYSMALGNHQTRIAGRSGEFLTAGLFLLLGLVLPLLLKPAIALDKFLLGFFYDNTEKLQATDLARGHHAPAGAGRICHRRHLVVHPFVRIKIGADAGVRPFFAARLPRGNLFPGAQITLVISPGVCYSTNVSVFLKRIQIGIIRQK